MLRNKLKLSRLKGHMPAWGLLFTVAIIVGCGSGSSEFFEGNERLSVSGLVLHERTRIVPSDGSVVVTSIGERGIQFRGEALNNVVPGDYIVVMAPITDEARRNVNHLGGHMALATGWHIVPREQIPSHVHTPGNAGYSHFAIHLGMVKDRFVDTGPLAESGSRAFAANNSTRGFIHSIAHAFSSAAHSVASVATDATSAVTNAATDVASDVTSAATVATSAVTNAATDIASDVTSSVTSAESAVTSAVSSIGPINQIETTLETVGVHFSEIVQAGEFAVSKAISDVEKIEQDIVAFAEFLITGNLTASFGENGSFNLTFDNYNVSSDDGSATATFNGDFQFGYSEDGTLKISSYVPQSLSFDYKVNSSVAVTLANVTGNKTLPIRTYKLSPVVIDAGIPIVIVREIDIVAVVDGSANPNATMSIGGSGDFGFSMDTGGVHVQSPSVSFNGDAAVSNPQANGTVSLVVTAHMKLYDVAGPFLQVTPTELSAVNVPANNEVNLTLSSSIDVGADMDLLGYTGWSAQTNVWHENWHTWSVGY